MMSEESISLRTMMDLYCWRDDGKFHAPANYITTDQRVKMLRLMHAIEGLPGLIVKWRAKSYTHDGVRLTHDEDWQDGREGCADDLEEMFGDRT